MLRAGADKEESLHNRAYIQLRGFGITNYVCVRDVALTWYNPEGEMFSHEGKLSSYTKFNTYSTYEIEAAPCASLIFSSRNGSDHRPPQDTYNRVAPNPLKKSIQLKLIDEMKWTIETDQKNSPAM